MIRKNPIILGFISFLLFFIAGILITYPLIFHMGNRATGTGDEIVIAWIQNWVIHALTTNPLSVFDANIYYPYHNTLAFSETFMLTSVLAIPIRVLVGQPIATVNFTLISSIILFGFSVYLLCYYLTKDFFASLFVGMMVIFSPAVLDYTVHLQMLSLECVPLSILFFLHFIKTRRSLFLSISLLFFVLQMYNSILPGYFIVFSFAVLLFFSLRSKKKVIILITKKNILLFITAFALLIPVAVPYFSVSREFNYVRDIRDAVHYAIQPEDFLYPGNRTRLHDFLMATVPTNHYSQNGEFKPAYLGVVFSLLVIFAAVYFIKNRKKNDLYMKSFLSTSLIGLILCLGPVLHLFRHTIHKPFLIPLPYAVLYYIIPGFQGFRDSARWNLLFILCIAVVIALMLHKILAKVSFRMRLLIFSLLFIGIFSELQFPLKLYPIIQEKDFPKVYQWLTTTSPHANIIELPIYNWNLIAFTQHELYREYFSSVDNRRMMNGATGFSPPPWQILVTNIDIGFPSNKIVNELKRLHINYVILHTDEFDALSKTHVFGKNPISNGETILKKTLENSSLKLVKTFSNTYVFHIK